MRASAFAVVFFGASSSLASPPDPVVHNEGPREVERRLPPERAEQARAITRALNEVFATHQRLLRETSELRRDIEDLRNRHMILGELLRRELPQIQRGIRDERTPAAALGFTVSGDTEFIFMGPVFRLRYTGIYRLSFLFETGVDVDDGAIRIASGMDWMQDWFGIGTEIAWIWGHTLHKNEVGLSSYYVFGFGPRLNIPLVAYSPWSIRVGANGLLGAKRLEDITMPRGSLLRVDVETDSGLYLGWEGSASLELRF